jgi:hypothetical protein
MISVGRTRRSEDGKPVYRVLICLSVGFTVAGSSIADATDFASAVAFEIDAPKSQSALLAPSLTIAQAQVLLGRDEQTISGEDAVRLPSSPRTSAASISAGPSSARDEGGRRKSDSPYDGTWRMTSSANSCALGLSNRVTISNGVIRGPGGQGRVTADGSISGSWTFIGLVNAALSGQMSSSSSGGGRWRNNYGCSGTWTISR